MFLLQYNRKQKTEEIMNIKIICPTAKHINQMAKLADESRQYHIDILGGYFTPVSSLPAEFERETIINHMQQPDKHIIFIAVDSDDNVIGMIMGNKLHKPWLEKSNVGHVGNFIVSDGARQQGVGQKLMDAFIDECKRSGLQEVTLGVYNKNQNAYKFYIKYGFEPIEQKMHIDLD